MNTEHKDIQRLLPYGESLRGFVNQSNITQAELNRILRERGIFSLNSDKDFTVPLLQTLLLSPKEFDKIRDAFSTREDNKKVFSRDINLVVGADLLVSDLLGVNVDDFIRLKLPTCQLEQPIRFTTISGNKNHLRAEFTLKRNDINKSWYEQTNIFEAYVDFVNDGNGKGRIIICHTAPETKNLAEYVVKNQVDEYKKKGVISHHEQLRKIVFNDFSNEERFHFLFRLTNNLDCGFFEYQAFGDISIKPEDIALPAEIRWMEELNKIILSGKSLDKKDFITQIEFHKHLVLWSVDTAYAYSFNGETGYLTISLGFPDYTSKKDNAEFEMHIVSIQPSKHMEVKSKNALKAKLLSEMDKQKSIVYNKFIESKSK